MLNVLALQRKLRWLPLICSTVRMAVNDTPSPPPSPPLVSTLDVPLNLLVDIDGTLAITDRLYLLAFQDLMRPFGYTEVDEAWFEKHVAGKVDAEVFGALLPAGATAEVIEATSRQKDAIFVQKVASVGATIVPGLADALHMARRCGWRCIAVTNAQRGGGQAVLDLLRRELGEGLASVIEDLVVGCECSRAKPHPDPYLEAMRRLGVAPEHCIVFEDSGTGVRAGAAAKVAAVVGIRTSLTDAALCAAGADATVADWSELSEAKLRELAAR